MDKRGGGVSRFSTEKFLSHSAENLRRESFIVALISGTGKVCRRQGEYQDFPSKQFCLTVPKFSVGESFTVAFISGIEQVWIRGGGGVSRFSMEKLLSHSAENLCRESFIVALISETGEVCRRRREYQDFPSKHFCLGVPKFSEGESLTVAFISGIEKVSIRGGGGEYQDFQWRSFCLTVPKISVGESFIVAIISGTGKVCRRRGEYQDFPSKVFCSQCRSFP